jgi:hypothetical protein
VKKPIWKSILKYVLTFAAGFGLVYAYIAPRDLASQTLIEQYHILCDAFTLPGLLMTCFGLMILMGNLGALDTLAYAVHFLLHTFIPLMGKGKSYLDFMLDRREHRVHGYGFLFVVGLVLTAIGVVFLLLYLNV